MTSKKNKSYPGLTLNNISSPKSACSIPSPLNAIQYKEEIKKPSNIIKLGNSLNFSQKQHVMPISYNNNNMPIIYNNNNTPYSVKVTNNTPEKTLVIKKEPVLEAIPIFKSTTASNFFKKKQEKELMNGSAEISYEQSLTHQEQRELRVKLMADLVKLKAKAPTLNILIPDENSSLTHLEDLYKAYEGEISTQINTTYLKIGLSSVFMAFEFFGKKFGLDIDGYAKSQNLDKYDGFLMELSEKYMSKEGESFQLSVDMRFFLFLILQAGLFMACKYADKFISGGGDYIKNFIEKNIEPVLVNSKESKIIVPVDTPPESNSIFNINNLISNGNVAGLFDMVKNIIPNKNNNNNNDITINSPRISPSPPRSGQRRRVVVN